MPNTVDVVDRQQREMDPVVEHIDWQYIFGGLCSVEQATGPAGGLTAYVDTSAALIVTNALPSLRKSTGLAAGGTGTDCYAITLVTSGAVVVDSGRPGAEPLRPGDAYLLDLAAVWSCAAAEPTPLDEVALYLPRQALMQNGRQLDTSGWMRRGDSRLGEAIGAILRMLGHQIARPDASIMTACADAIRDMVLADLSKSAAIVARSGAIAAPATKLEAIRRFIDKHIRSDALTPDLIAGDFGLSRAVLYRMFEPLGGVTTYIRRQRMARALSELGATGTRPRISILAHRYGYKDAAAFTRAFKETYGISPREVGKRPVIRPGGDRLIDLLAPICGLSPPLK